MKAIKGRILKKLTSFPQVGSLIQPQIPPPNPSDPTRILRDLPNCREESTEPVFFETLQPMRDFKANDEENKENIQSFRRPDPNSSTLFDPALLAAFQQAVMDQRIKSETSKQEEEDEEEEEEKEPPLKILRTSIEDDPLSKFDAKCPPGGRDSIIIYTTSLRGIRKTFDECTSVRFLFKTLKLEFTERDLSMHRDFREELCRVLGGRAIPPRVFIRGRYIGGADEVLALHEQGKLLPLVRGMPIDQSGGAACEVCCGTRFAVCTECSGSRKVYDDEVDMSVQCPRCNENGLIVCSMCC